MCCSGLLRDAEGDCWALFLGTTLLFQWAADDRATRRLVAAQMVNAKLATRVEVAQIFGLHPKSVSRIARQVANDGVAATIARQPGPRGPHKVTPEVLAAVERGLAAGLTSAAIAGEVRRRLGISLSRQHVVRLMRHLREQAVRQEPLDPANEPAQAEAGEAPERAAGGADGEPPSDEWEVAAGPGEPLPEPGGPVLPAPGEAVRSRYMGLTLFYLALEVSGLLTVAEQVYQVTGAVRFGVRQVFLQLFSLLCRPRHNRDYAEVRIMPIWAGVQAQKRT